MDKESSEMNLEQLCRVCLQETPLDVINLNNLLDGRDVTFADAFTKITGFKILANEPQSLCTTCGEMVSLAYELLQKAEATQFQLEEMLPKIDTHLIKLEPVVTDSGSDSDWKEEERPYKCDWCAKSYTKQMVLYNHIKTIHPEEQPFECRDCNQRFLFESKLDSHQKYCKKRPKTKQSKFVCPVCGLLASKDHIRNHSRSGTKETSVVQTYVCDLCGVTTSSRASIANHMRFQHLHIKAKCKHCQAAFKNPSALARHMRKSHHDKTREFHCRQCDFSSLKETELRRHRLVHSGKKLMKCQICGLEFMNNCKLQIHMASHSDARPFTCETCGSAFKTKKGLGAHKKTHKAYDYECPVCQRAYLTNQLMRNHAEKNHPEYQLPPPGTVFSKSWKIKLAEQQLKDMAMQQGIKTEGITMEDLPQVQYYQPYFRT